MTQIFNNGVNGYKFAITDQIGKGGNGEIYKIKLLEKDYSKELVAKIFCCRGKYVKEKYERFRKEVEALYYNLSDVDGVMKIVDYYTPEKYIKTENQWYIMPLAERFECKDFEEIIYKFLDLANIIKRIHVAGMRHRDIKPENILILDNNICLSDFGLVLFNDEDRLTGSNENVGPFIIAPPEYNCISQIDFEDQQYFDVYLFAKTLWIYLKNEKRGFSGEYNIENDEIRVENETIQSLYPINKLLESATKHNIKDRITIDECIKLIKEQIKIINNEVDISTINKYNLLEKSRIRQNSLGYDYCVFNDYNKIFDYLSGLIEIAEVDVLKGVNNAKVKTIKPSKIMKNNNTVIFEERIGYKKKEYILSICELKYFYDKKIVINLNNLDNENISGYISIDDIFKDNESNIYISEDYILLINIAI